MIVYLHGFNSTGQSAKGKIVREYFSNKTDVYTPTYNYSPREAVTFLKQYISELSNKNEPLLIIGSSLGGFYAQYLASVTPGCDAVLINPALGPVETLKNHLGENTNFYTGETYILTPGHLEELRQYDIASPCNYDFETLLLADKADEIIDYHFAAEKYRLCSHQVLYEGGNHQFQHMPEALIEIEKFYQSKVNSRSRK